MQEKHQTTHAGTALSLPRDTAGGTSRSWKIGVCKDQWRLLGSRVIHIAILDVWGEFLLCLTLAACVLHLCYIKSSTCRQTDFMQLLQLQFIPLISRNCIHFEALTHVHCWPSAPMEVGGGGGRSEEAVSLGWVWFFFLLEWKYLGKSDWIWESLDLYRMKTAANLCLGFLVRTGTRLLKQNATWKDFVEGTCFFWHWRSPRVTS